MRLLQRSFTVAFAASLVLIVAACAHGNLDDGDSANVILTVQTVPSIPPVTAAPSPGGTGCTFTVPNTNVSLGSRPKTELALGSPFSDIAMDDVVITYEWVNPTGGEVTEDTLYISGTIPVNGTQTVSFVPIRLDYLNQGISGRTANLTLLFHGHTLDGHAVAAFGRGGQLSINSCTTSTVCGDGSIDGAEQCDDGGTNSGDGCSSSCQIESGWVCSGQPSVCQIRNP